MELEQLITRDGAGWIASAAMVAWFARAWIRGEVVSGKTHEYLKAELERVSRRTEELADAQRREAAEERERLLALIQQMPVGGSDGE